ncbi:hypothetical protein Dsin_030652 [Dipteronia sinensis]|uniref:Gag1-like clamp domain-containing protein n=1 Tax=Dipteronia sinensis TaxID=43782 RepID=A0AAD9ZJH8_9ROSI|nr:hypothetical protein Dsin_030652 [Dipteronia sinensis]
MSSISISNQTLNYCSGSSSMSSNSDLLNHGLLLWNQSRLQWIGSSRSKNNTQQIWEPKSRTLLNFWWTYWSMKDCMIEKLICKTDLDMPD